MINKNSRFFVSRFLCFFVILILFQAIFYSGFDYYFQVENRFLNVPDHLFYEGVITGFNLVPDITSINNYVVSFIYSLFFEVGFSDLILVSLFVNVIVISVAYARSELLCFQVTKRFLPLLYWLGLLSALQFSILINKDSFGVLFYVVLVSFLMFRKKTDLCLLLILCPIRLQFLLVFVFSVFIVSSINSRDRKIKVIAKVGFLYFLCSIVAMYLESNEALLAHSHYAEGGVAQWISNLNKQFYIGSLLLNVLKPVQYVYDLFRSASVDYSVLGWGVYFSRLYLFFLIVVLSAYFFIAVYLPWIVIRKREVFIASVVICSFFLVYSISPVVNYRYLLNISPVLILFFAMKKSSRVGGRLIVPALGTTNGYLLGHRADSRLDE